MQLDLALSSLGTVIAVVMFASQIPLVAGIIRNRSDSSAFPFAPTFCLLLNCLLWAGYAQWVQHRWDTLAVNSIGVVFALSYAAIFWRFSRSRAGRTRIAVLTLGGVGATLAFFLGLFEVPGTGLPDTVKAQIAAMAAVVFNVSIFVSPVRAVVVAVRELDLSRLPVLMAVASWAASLVWGAFGVVIADYFIVTPNAIGLTLSTIQLALIAYVRHRQRVLGVRDGGKPAGPEVELAAGSTSHKAATGGAARLAATVSSSSSASLSASPSSGTAVVAQGSDLAISVQHDDHDETPQHGAEGSIATPAVIVRMPSAADAARSRGATATSAGASPRPSGGGAADAFAHAGRAHAAPAALHGGVRRGAVRHVDADSGSEGGTEADDVAVGVRGHDDEHHDAHDGTELLPAGVAAKPRAGTALSAAAATVIQHTTSAGSAVLRGLSVRGAGSPRPRGDTRSGAVSSPGGAAALPLPPPASKQRAVSSSSTPAAVSALHGGGGASDEDDDDVHMEVMGVVRQISGAKASQRAAARVPGDALSPRQAGSAGAALTADGGERGRGGE